MLNAESLSRLPPDIQQPDYQYARLGIGILHLGLGAFHRAHQALYTEDAIRAAGGEWGIVGVAFRNTSVPAALRAQDHLYTVETLRDPPQYRVSAAVRSVLNASAEAPQLTACFGNPQIHVVTLTITEKGYCLNPDGALDVSHDAIVHDLAHPLAPQSAIGWLARGLAHRCHINAAPLTVISCDNLNDNGSKLAHAVAEFLERTQPDVLPWLMSAVTFPRSVVDCIVPASSEASLRRVYERLRAADAAAVQREPYSQWAIEDAFAGPRPRWERAGVQIVADVGDFARLKLHVLNACHSALAYLGLPRGHTCVRDAIADPELAQFLDDLVDREIGPALAPLATEQYWRTVSARFRNARIEHRLSQIAEDGGLKLSQRVFPLMIANLQRGAPLGGLARIVRAWLDFTRQDVRTALDQASLFPVSLGANPVARAAILAAHP